METAARAPRLGHDPRQARLDGGGAVVEVVAVEAHAGFQAEAVPRAQAGEAERLGVLAHQVLGDGGGVLRRDGDLEPVFAGVTATADKAGRGERAVGELQGEGGALPEVERVEAGATGGEDRGEDRGGEGALERDEILRGEDGVREAGRGVEGGDLSREVGEVFRAAGGVGDDVEGGEGGGRGEAGDDGVVHDAAGDWMEETRKSGMVGCEGGDGGGGDEFEEGGAGGAGEVVLHPGQASAFLLCEAS